MVIPMGTDMDMVILSIISLRIGLDLRYGTMGHVYFVISIFS